MDFEPLPFPRDEVMRVMHRRFAEVGRWPQPSWVEGKLRDEGIDAYRVMRELPREWVWGSAHHADAHLHEPVGLRVEALAHLPEAEPVLDLFLWALDRMHWVEKPRDDDDPDEPREREWSSADAREARPSLTAIELRQIYYLVQSEQYLDLGGSGPGADHEEWSFKLAPELQHYIEIETIDAYLEVKAELRAQPVVYGTHPALAAQIEFMEQGKSVPVPEPRWQRRRRAVKGLADFVSDVKVLAGAAVVLVVGAFAVWKYFT